MDTRRPALAAPLLALVLATVTSVGAAAADHAGVTASGAPTAAPVLDCRAGGDRSVGIPVGGGTRQVLVHVPAGASASPAARLPVVIAFHGFSATAGQMADTTRLSAMADETGFAVLYPQGAGSPSDWRFPGHPEDRLDDGGDLAFVAALLDAIGQAPCLDRERVLLAGHSMGGGMAAAAACRFADRVAGVVLVSAVQFPAPCDPGRPVPVTALHALDDEVLPYGGGPIAGTPSWFPRVLPVETALGAWAMRLGCDGPPEVIEQGDGSADLAWPGCAAPVVLHRLATGGHAWAPVASDVVVRALLAAGAAHAGR